MVIIQNYLGSISISHSFFSQLIGDTLVSCFGVADTNAGRAGQKLFGLFTAFHRKRQVDRGVTVRASGGKLEIDLHITVMYGVNVSSVVQSIQHKIIYVTEEETGLKVQRVNVYVDGMKS